MSDTLGKEEDQHLDSPECQSSKEDLTVLSASYLREFAMGGTSYLRLEDISDFHKATLNRAILRENAAAQACAMELKMWGDVKFTADEYKEARIARMQLEAN